jgi:hypothetical protein
VAAQEPEAEAEPEPEPQAAAEPADDDIEVELQSAPTLELKDSYPAVQLEADVVLSAGSEGMVVVVAEEAETQLLYPYGCITSWYLGPHDPSADEDGRALRVCLRVSAGLVSGVFGVFVNSPLIDCTVSWLCVRYPPLR